MKSFAYGVLLCTGFACSASVVAQERQSVGDAYSRKNTFTLFAEGSAPSTPIIAGGARQRLLIDAGGAYTRRVFRFWGTDLGYHIELRPLVFESDPLTINKEVVTYTSGQNAGMTYTSVIPIVESRCVPETFIGSQPSRLPDFPGYNYTITDTCGRQWTYGQSFAPIGFKYSLRTAHPLQPFIIGTLGYMYTSRPVPLPSAEAFNFVINVGTGIELYRSARRSVSLEARVQHFSNRNTAQENPGADNLMFKVSYSFGR